MKLYSPGPPLLCCLLAFTGSILAQGAEGAVRFVIPSGQEGSIGRMLNIEPRASGGWWFQSAEVPGDEILAVFERLGDDDPRMKSPPQELMEGVDSVALETARLRLVHPDSAPPGSAASDRFAVIAAVGADAPLPTDLLQPLLERLIEEERSFVWHETRGRVGGDSHGLAESSTTRTSPGSKFFATVSGRWALSAAFVALTLGVVAGGRWVLLLRGRRPPVE